ncbi:MAG: hypothetical protein IIW93_03900 [Bacteroidaceae bacterium]|nr:hypothetical protein [Bacteroidaceae bacterium]
MDTTDNIYDNFNAFKEDLLQWKNAHQEEYAQFARQMNDGDGLQFVRFFYAANQQLPGLIKTWQTFYDDDTVDNLSQMTLYFKEKAIPQQIIEQFHRQKDEPPIVQPEPQGRFSQWFNQQCSAKKKEQIMLSAPLVLSWLIFGRSFEAMADALTSMANNPSAGIFGRFICSCTIKHVINASIKSGYRTHESWREYVELHESIRNGKIASWALKSIKTNDNDKASSVQPSIIQEEEVKARGRRAAQEKSLIEYLKCDNTEGVIDVIRDFVTTHNTSYGLALPYYALSELNLFTELINAKEYSTGLVREFSDIEGLKSESSCRQAIKWFKDEKHVERDGKMQMLPLIESDEYQRQLHTLKVQITEAINQYSTEKQLCTE